MKTCKTCKIEKPLESFSKHRGSCNKCRSKQNAEYYKTLSTDELDRRKQQGKDWRDNNTDKVKMYQKKKYDAMRNNPETYNKHKLRTQVAHFFNAKSKTAKTEELLGYALDVFYDYFAKDIERFQEAGEQYHIDHKIPLSWFKEDAPVSMIWDLRNLQIVPATYNTSKRNFYMDDVPRDYLQEAVKYINHPMVEE